MPTPLLSNFTPSLMSPETLERIFVQREDIAQDLVDRIILSATTLAKHHSLLIGARGMGKTHLVSLVYYRLQQHQELQDKLMVAWMREDEWGIDSWLDLVVRIFRALAAENIETKGLLAQLQQVSIADAETLATQLLTELIGNKTLLLIIENLDDLFAGLGESGQQKFRAFLQERQCCTILATTPALFTGVQNRSEPFFGFFNPIPLSPLNWEEATVMLQKIAELDGQADLANFLRTPAGKARVRAVHHLAGGNPRVYTLFAQFITRESLDELVQAFMKMLDDLTPYYQSRMKELSNQQRKIVEFLVDRREAVMVKEIATQCFIEQRVVSGQLLQLRNKGYVVARANGRESFYELTEVLMRLCMEVKKYRGQWVELFVNFLRIWYRPAERQARLAMLRGNGGLISDEHLEFALASDADPVLLMVNREFQHALGKKDRNLTAQVLAELQAIGGMSEEKCQQISELVNADKFDEVREILDLNVDPDSNGQEIEFQSEDVEAWNNQGEVMFQLGKYERALDCYRKATQFDPAYSDAWNNQGKTLFRLGKFEEAIECYQQATRLNPEFYAAWNHIGIAQFQLQHYDAAIISYDRTLQLNPEFYQAWYNKGMALFHLGKYAQALTSYKQTLNLQPDYYQAWNNLGFVLFHLEMYDKAIISYSHALKLNPEFYVAWYNLGIALATLEKYSDAIKSYDRALRLEPNDPYIWNSLGKASAEVGHYEEAITIYERAISIKPDKYNSWHSKGIVLFSMGNNSAALTTWQQTFNIIYQTTNRPYDVAELIQEFIEVLIPKFTQPAVKTMLTELVQTYIKTSVLTELGTALVRTIKQILAPDISDYTAQQWLELWQELLGDTPELQLPFRLMKTAIDYKQHPERKERLWLGLASEERSILDEALEF